MQSTRGFTRTLYFWRQQRERDSLIIYIGKPKGNISNYEIFWKSIFCVKIFQKDPLTEKPWELLNSLSLSISSDLPSDSCLLMVLNCTHPKYCSYNDPASVFFVTTSTMYHWVIFAPAAFLRSGSNVSGFLSEIEPWSFVIRQYLSSQEIPQTNW